MWNSWFLRLAGLGPAPAARSERMLAAIRHRGPDGWGIHLDRPVGLGHVRLSIIDLAGGGQPMADESENVWVTFNGEIFNYVELRAELIAAGHRFRTSSDTEVILQAYRRKGPRCVEDFNGDFAFALWDKQRDRLVLARDRMGIRPIYYAIKDGVLVFGSEAKRSFRSPACAVLDPVSALPDFHILAPVGPPDRLPGHPRAAAGTLARRPRRLGHRAGILAAQLPDCSRQGPDAASRGRARRGASRLVARRHPNPPPGRRPGGSLPERRAGFLGHRRAHPARGPGSPADLLRRLRVAGVRREPVPARDGPCMQCDHESVTVTDHDIAASFPDVIRHTERPILRTAPAPLYRLARLVGRIPARSF